jgi:hypothetical protein
VGEGAKVLENGGVVNETVAWCVNSLGLVDGGNLLEREKMKQTTFAEGSPLSGVRI